MQVLPTKFDTVKLIVPDVFKDERGYFKETFSETRYADAGIRGPFVQDNLSLSHRGVLRGMHFDLRMAKLVQVLVGTIFDAVIDMREGSPTFKQWAGFELSAQNHHQLFVPAGFAHGFLTLSDEAVVQYKQTALYDPHHERALSWRDESVGIAWPLDGLTPKLSAKDAAL